MTTPNNADAAFGSKDNSLTGLVQRLGDDLRQLTRRIDDHEDQILDTLESLAAELDTLRDELDRRSSPGGRVVDPGSRNGAARLSTGGAGDQPPVPRRWAARASRQDWDTFIEWVDHLRCNYSLPNGYVVPPCWPAHPGVVEELAALYRAWVNAVLVDEDAAAAGSSAVAAWHDRWLWPTLRRFKDAAYRTANCTQKHVIDTGASAATDRSHIPPGSAPTLFE